MERLLIGSLELSKTTTGKAIANLYSTDTRLVHPVLVLFDLSALATVGLDPKELEPGARVPHRFWAHYTTSEKLNSHGNPYRNVEYLENIEQPATSTSTDTTALLDELRAIRAGIERLEDTLRRVARGPLNYHLGEDEPTHQPQPGEEPPALPDDEEPPTLADEIVKAITEDEPAAAAAPAQADPDTGEVPGAEPVRRYANGTLVSDNSHEQQAYDSYIRVEREPPYDVEHLRGWVLDTPAARR